MKLKYKILWVEDNPKSIRRDKSRIIEYLTDLGFECIDSNPETDIEIITSFDEFQTKIGYSKTSDFDLLLVDLDLGKRVSKDEGEETPLAPDSRTTRPIFYRGRTVPCDYRRTHWF